MKVSKKIRLMSCCGLAIFTLAACSTNQNQSMEQQNGSTTKLVSSDKESYKGTYSNLNSKASEEEVRKALAAHLDKDSVDAFFNLVNDYNNTVGSVGLTGDFSTFTKNEYDVERLAIFGHRKKVILSGLTVVLTVIVY